MLRSGEMEGDDHVKQDEAAQTSDSDLDPEVKEDLKMELKLRLKAIKDQYASYVSYIYESIKDTVSVESLRVYLLDLSALDCDKDEDEERYKLLYAMKTKLRQAKSIHDIVISLQEDCATFLHYDVFHFIQKKYKIAVSEELNYPEHFKAYINKHKVSEFFAINPKLEKFPTSEKLILKFNIPHTSRVAKVIDLKVAIAEVLNLKPSALELVSVDKGCVEVTFLVSSFVAAFIVKELSSKSKIEEFQALPVVWLNCGPHHFDFNGEDIQTDTTDTKQDDPQHSTGNLHSDLLLELSIETSLCDENSSI